MKYCSHCGTKIEDENARFCFSCGTQLANPQLKSKLSEDPTVPSIESLLSSMEKLEGKEATSVNGTELAGRPPSESTLPQDSSSFHMGKNSVESTFDINSSMASQPPSFVPTFSSESPVKPAASQLVLTPTETAKKSSSVVIEENLFDTATLPDDLSNKNLFSTASFQIESEEIFTTTKAPTIFEPVDNIEDSKKLAEKEKLRIKAELLAKKIAQEEESTLFHPNAEENSTPSLENLFDLSNVEKSPPRPPLPPTPVSSKKSNRESSSEDGGKGKKIAFIILFILFFALATFAATIGMLAWSNQPGKTVNAFVDALNAKDYEALEKTAYINGTVATKDGWDALQVSFSSAERVDELKKNFSIAAASTSSFPAISLGEDPLFLFIKKYYIKIEGCEVLIPNGMENVTLVLGETTYTGSQVSNGTLYPGVFPGSYTALLDGLNPDGSAFSSPSFPLEVVTPWRPNQPTAADGNTETYTLTIQNSLEENAVLSVNGTVVPAKPIGGVVVLPDVPLNSTIRITAKQDGVEKQAEILFSDPSNLMLQFGEYTPIAPTPSSSTSSDITLSPEEINTILSTFYTSYLNSINNQNVDELQLSTERNKTDITTRITKPSNKANTFSFVSATVDSESIVVGAESGTPSIVFNATFSFNYKERDTNDSEAAGSNNQSVQLLYVDGKWLVDNFTFVSDEDFKAHKVATFK